MSAISLVSKRTINIISILLPLAVAGLFGIKIEGYDLSFLPPVYAGINGLTAIILTLAVIQIKKGNRKGHERLIKGAMALSLLFLTMYIAYHITSESTSFGGEGYIKYAYYFILITHIILSVVVIPFVLYAYLFGSTNQLEKHKKIVRYSFPLWLYVAISGVIVYIMISPYY